MSTGVNGDKPLPYSEDAEKGVLCSLKHSPDEVASLCAQRVRPEHFLNAAHRLVFGLFLEFIDARKPLDFPLVKKALTDQLKDLVDNVPQFLNGIYTFIDTGSNATWYIDLLLETWRDYRGVVLGRELGKGASFPEVFEKLQAVDSDYQSLSGWPPFESVDSFLEEKIAEPPEIVSGLIHQGSKTGIGGGSKSYKTWILTELAVSVAAGVTWLGRSALCGKVLYVNLEIQGSFYKKRVKAIAEAKGLATNGDWRKNLEVWNLRGYCVDAESLCKRLRKLAGKGYSLFIVDPIYKIVGKREENSNEQITSLLNMLEQVARETDAAIVYGNHFSKGNQAAKEAIDRISGAGAFARDPDTIITLTKHESDGVYTVECTLRNFPPIEPFCVRWQYPLFIQDGSLDPEKLKQVMGRKAKWTVTQLVECLGDKDLKSTQFQKLVAAETGMPKTNFYELLPQAKAQGLLHKCVADDKWEVVRK